MSPTATAPAAPPSAFARARAQFAADTETHQLTILRDEGLYRHLRFRRAGREFRCYEVSDIQRPSGFFGFDLVTWPGYLAFVGDAGDYVFSRLADMFEFFHAPHGDISYDYWASKLVAPAGSASVRSFSRDAYRRQVEAWIAEQEDRSVARAARRQLLETEQPAGNGEAHRLLREFEHNGVEIWDPWEWDFRDWDLRYLWCCCAIAFGVARYRAAKGTR